MIQQLKSDDIADKVGGKFRLAALMQRRLKELIEGGRPLVDGQNKTLVEIVAQEIMEDKIAIDYDQTEGLEAPVRKDRVKGFHAGTETEEATG
jgi:DNA-directed RNA polymerase subunit omega